jgi:hypothetical protein
MFVIALYINLYRVNCGLTTKPSGPHGYIGACVKCGSGTASSAWYLESAEFIFVLAALTARCKINPSDSNYQAKVKYGQLRDRWCYDIQSQKKQMELAKDFIRKCC